MALVSYQKNLFKLVNLSGQLVKLKFGEAGLKTFSNALPKKHNYNRKSYVFDLEEREEWGKTTPENPFQDRDNVNLKYAKNEQETLIGNALIDKKLNSIEMIEDLKENLISSGKFITPRNFDSILLACCTQYKSFDVGKKFFYYEYEKNKNLSVGFIGAFFRLCYNNQDMCTDQDKELIYTLYQSLLEKYEILDGKTWENSVLALSITDKWKEIEGLNRICGGTGIPTLNMYVAFATAAIVNKEMDYALQIMEDAINNNKNTMPQVFKAFMTDGNLDRLNDVFYWLAKHNLPISAQLAHEIMNVHTQITGDRYRSSLTGISPRGECRKCLRPLDELIVTEEEYVTLKDAFLDPVLIGKDIFLKTKPAELDRFKKFLNNLGEVDVVLDGLNIAYTVGKARPHVQSHALKLMVNHFVKNNKNVVVFGRKHMLGWPAQSMNYIQEHSKLFLTDNVSTDDPFLLYTTMHCGLGTMFVSRDEMRGHKFLLKDPKLKYIFNKWQQKYQLHYSHMSDSGEVSFKNKLPYLQDIQRSEDGLAWHLPIAPDPSRFKPGKEMARPWLCVS